MRAGYRAESAGSNPQVTNENGRFAGIIGIFQKVSSLFSVHVVGAGPCACPVCKGEHRDSPLRCPA